MDREEARLEKEIKQLEDQQQHDSLKQFSSLSNLEAKPNPWLTKSPWRAALLVLFTLGVILGIALGLYYGLQKKDDTTNSPKPPAPPVVTYHWQLIQKSIAVPDNPGSEMIVLGYHAGLNVGFGVGVDPNAQSNNNGTNLYVLKRNLQTHQLEATHENFPPNYVPIFGTFQLLQEDDDHLLFLIGAAGSCSVQVYRYTVSTGGQPSLVASANIKFGTLSSGQIFYGPQNQLFIFVLLSINIDVPCSSDPGIALEQGLVLAQPETADQQKNIPYLFKLTPYKTGYQANPFAIPPLANLLNATCNSTSYIQAGSDIPGGKTNKLEAYLLTDILTKGSQAPVQQQLPLPDDTGSTSYGSLMVASNDSLFVGGFDSDAATLFQLVQGSWQQALTVPLQLDDKAVGTMAPLFDEAGLIGVFPSIHLTGMISPSPTPGIKSRWFYEKDTKGHWQLETKLDSPEEPVVAFALDIFPSVLSRDPVEKVDFYIPSVYAGIQSGNPYPVSKVYARLAS